MDKKTDMPDDSLPPYRYRGIGEIRVCKFMQKKISKLDNPS